MERPGFVPFDQIKLPESEKPGHECGVFGLYFPHPYIENKMAFATFTGLHENQNRGEESAGIAVANGESVSPVYKRRGLVKDVYNSFVTSESHENSEYHGYIGIGHTRYSTTGVPNEKNAGPFRHNTEDMGSIVVAHNGNITNAVEIKAKLLEQGVPLISTTDSEVIGALIASTPGETWDDKIAGALAQLKGSFSLVMTTKDTMYAARDPMGNRPLSIASFEKEGVTGYSVSSETPAFDILDINYQREVGRGELVKFGKNGIGSIQFAGSEEEAFCGMEIAYMMKANARINNEQLDTIRRRLGERLAELSPPPADDIDFVTYIPLSAASSGEGYAEGLSKVLDRPIPCRISMLKDRYGGQLKEDGSNGGIRGFMQPDQEARKVVADKNYKPFDWVEGKNIVVIDDSIVRGTTTAGVLKTLSERIGLYRDSGAKNIDLRIIFPIIIDECPYGTDIKKEQKLFGLEYPSLEEMAEALGVRSIEFHTPESFEETQFEITKKKTCKGCTTSKYPQDFNRTGKFVFEQDKELAAQAA